MTTPNPYGEDAVKDDKPRCWRCSKLLAETLTRPWVIVCPRCKAKNAKE